MVLKLLNSLEYFNRNKLSLLRFFISILVGYDVYKTALNLFFNVPNNKLYNLNQTWISSLFPEQLFDFNPENFIYYKLFLFVVIICSALGILGRLSLILLATTTALFYGMDEGLGSFDHQLSFSTQVLFILALVPGSMGISIDSFFARKWFFKRNSFNYFSEQKWGINLILILLVCTYLTAGISKLRFGGMSYLDGSTIGFYIQDHTFEYEQGKHKLILGDSSLPEAAKWKDKYGLQAYTYSNIQSSQTIRKIQYWITEKPNLLKFITISALIFEFGGFIVFFGSKYRNFYLFIAFMFHTTIGFLMGFTFYQYRLIILCLVDWESIFSFVKGVKIYKNLSAKLAIPI